MKKLIAILGTLSLLFVSYLVFNPSTTTPTIVNHSNKASPGTVLAKSFEDNLLIGTTFWQADNCEQADAKYVNTPNAVMIFNANVSTAGKDKNMDCPFRGTPTGLVFIGKSYFNICTNANDPKEITDSTTLGMASVIYNDGIMNSYNSNGLSLDGVPYGGSRNVLAAVIANEIDFGIIGVGIAKPAMEQGTIICPYTTDPSAENYQGNVFDMVIPDMHIASSIYTNSTDEALITSLRAAASTEAFMNYLNKSGFGYSKSNSFDDADVTAFNAWITNLYEKYWKYSE